MLVRAVVDKYPMTGCCHPEFVLFKGMNKMSVFLMVECLISFTMISFAVS